MRKIFMNRVNCLIAVLLLYPTFIFAQEVQAIRLLEPKKDGGKPLMQVLNERRSSREFSPQNLPLQVLSNLLWAADGLNRPQSGKRTAPSAWNWQNIDIYVATAEGVFIFDVKAHTLNRVLPKDIRPMTGTQPYAADAPVNLIYIANYADLTILDSNTRKRIPAPHADKVFYSVANAGFIGQNVYLYCASEGLATVVRGLIDKPALANAMKLRPDQEIILAQSVGYPKK